MKKNQYVFYEYLHFFWKKKIVLFAIPVVVALIALVYTFSKPDVYRGEVTVFTSSIGKDSLTHPDLIKSNYTGKINDSAIKNFNVNATTGRVLFTFTGTNKEEIKRASETIEKDYLPKLNKAFEEKKSILEDQVAIYELAVKEYEAKVTLLEKKAEQDTLTIEDLNFKNDSDSTVIYFEDLKSARLDLKELDPPKILSKSIAKSNNYLGSNLLVSILFGFILSILTIMVWKYILDARKGQDNW
jgi:hypothetical protein